MSDICSPMVILLENEADAFWCFEHVMRRVVRLPSLNKGELLLKKQLSSCQLYFSPLLCDVKFCLQHQSFFLASNVQRLHKNKLTFQYHLSVFKIYCIISIWIQNTSWFLRSSLNQFQHMKSLDILALSKRHSSTLFFSQRGITRFICSLFFPFVGEKGGYCVGWDLVFLVSFFVFMFGGNLLVYLLIKAEWNFTTVVSFI